MSNVAKLKKEAADLEQKKQFDKALKVYVRLFAEFEKHPQEVDVAMYNRVGDIQVKLGQVAEAVDTYEKGVDFYAEGGFFNNAIALGNKILRQAPGRSSIYYKLGKINAQKGFKAEARQNYLEYANRMEKSGNTGEAFRSLIEFMDLVPDQDDIRAMLADQLIKADRKPDAVIQLQRLYERHLIEGRGAEADAVAAKVQSLDPAVDLSSSTPTAQASSGGDLVFLDLDAPARPSGESKPAAAPTPPPRPAAPPPAPAPAPPPPPRPAAVAPPPPNAVPLPPAAPPPEMEITRASDQQVDVSSAMLDIGLGIEPTSLAGSDAPSTMGGGLDIEPTSFGEVSLQPDEASPPPAAPSAEPPSIEEDFSFEMPGASSMAELELESAPAPEPEEEHEMLDISSIPETSIAPLIDDDVDKEPAISMDLLDLDPVEEEPEPLPEPEPALPPVPPPAPKRAPPVPHKIPPKPVAAKPVAPPTAPKPTPAVPPPPARSAANPIAAAMPDFDLGDAALPRRSSVFAAKAVNILQAAVAGAPEDWSLRRELAEGMLEAGDRSGGLHELEVAMNGAENSDDLELAMALAEELGKLEPLVVKHHQKRVEYAFRRNDKPRLVDAYLTLGDALMQNDQTEKARAVYKRVLDLSPDNLQAQAAVEALSPAAPAAPPTPASRRSSTAATKRPTGGQVRPTPDAVPASDDGFVNLGDWLREDEGPKDTRMVVDEQEPTGDENADFADMLKKFKQGVAENVDAEDYQSHYDLAIAFKEMGLLDEAIAGFQRALGSKQNRLPTYEALGECFIEKGQAKMAGAILNRAIGESKEASDDQLVGVLYLLGRAAEEQGQAAQALEFYQRVFVIDIQFKDVADRMSSLDEAAR